MEEKIIFSIGHGTRKLEEFLDLLKKYSINFLIDVRSQPYSKYSPQYNQNILKDHLEMHNIKYVFMGDSLGGRPKDLSCYDEEGKVDYLKIKIKDFYLDGINRLKTAYQNNIKVVIMCSESNPCECHRSKLIGMSLVEDSNKIFISHIDEKGRLKDQATVMNELNKGRNPKDLFDQQSNTTSRKSYV